MEEGNLKKKGETINEKEKYDEANFPSVLLMLLICIIVFYATEHYLVASFSDQSFSLKKQTLNILNTDAMNSLKAKNCSLTLQTENEKGTHMKKAAEEEHSI